MMEALGAPQILPTVLRYELALMAAAMEWYEHKNNATKKLFLEAAQRFGAESARVAEQEHFTCPMGAACVHRCGIPYEPKEAP